MTKRKKIIGFQGFNTGRQNFRMFTDIDRDGVRNRKDCRPFNWKWQHEEDIKGFSDKTTVPIADYPEGYGYKGKTKMMTPKEFLEIAKKGYRGEERFFDEEKHRKMLASEENIEKIKQGLQERKGKVPVGYIEYNKGNIEHEGRHRAWAAQDLGISEIPVKEIWKEED